MIAKRIRFDPYDAALVMTLLLLATIFVGLAAVTVLDYQQLAADFAQAEQTTTGRYEALFAEQGGEK